MQTIKCPLCLERADQGYYHTCLDRSLPNLSSEQYIVNGYCFWIHYQEDSPLEKLYTEVGINKLYVPIEGKTYADWWLACLL